MLKNLKKLFKENTYFLVPFFIFILLSSLIITNFKKEDSIILLNNNIHDSLDLLKYLTFAGDGIFFMFIILLFLFIRFKYAFLLFISGCVSSTIIKIIKENTENNFRPRMYFIENNLDLNKLNFVSGVEIHELYSFPSGHTSISFCVFMMLSIFLQKKYQKFICFIIAFIVGFSRIYLYQHFLEDVFAGAIVGVFSSFFIYFFFSNRKFLKNPFFEKNILNVRK